MDSVTQAVLGAGIQGALLGSRQGRKALVYGALLGTLPDLDVLIRYPDPVSMMTFHRGFSHSVFVLTALALVLTALIRWRWPKAPYGAGRLFLTLWLVLITHPVLDSFTVYGTQLFWPLTPTPESWSAVFIIDPIYTVPMLCAVLATAIFGATPRLCRVLAITVIWGAVYLGTGLVGRWHAEREVTQALRAQGLTPTRVLATPMPFNTMLWRVIAQTGPDTYYEGVSGWFDRHGPQLLEQPIGKPLGDQISDDALLQRLAWFTNGWLRFDAIDDRLVVTDLRMGMPGYYTFRFVMGERRDGQWHAVVPSRWPSERGTGDQLRQLLTRIVDTATPLPLADWAMRTGQ
ncbi:hydrolase [Bordetella genomosp. 5]|uniref:metal-dependent hydrolase n=1 Tax=Bordetella genomosp. 5 TaxID=1395608 RepID=UPI000B9DEFDF|nr:metal-dependent hydrolase [Bordetella genomosp. 5]OZI44611.1 hydrolase [Bordetella genomosp. 5]